MVEGGPIDVLTGDWLAELTMYILHKTRERSGGYARTFLRQTRGGAPHLHRAGHHHRLQRRRPQPRGTGRRGVGAGPASGRRLCGWPRCPVTTSPTGYPTLQAAGWPFLNLDTGEPLPTDAAAGHGERVSRRPAHRRRARRRGAGGGDRAGDRRLGRSWAPPCTPSAGVTTTSTPLAGAVVAGHVIECGAQCCGGNYAFFDEIPHPDRIGFPIAELHPDGSSVITKHPGTGGAVTVGTVTAQLLYEIAGPRYLSPDAVARFDTIAVAQEGPDRVRIDGVVGEPPPSTLKVTANLDGGWRNSMTLAITGARVEEKARLAADTVWAGIAQGRAAFAETSEDLSGDLSGDGLAFLRLAVRGDDEATVGRAFSGAVVETSLSSYPGTFFTTAPPRRPRRWPATGPPPSRPPRSPRGSRATAWPSRRSPRPGPAGPPIEAMRHTTQTTPATQAEQVLTPPSPARPGRRLRSPRCRCGCWSAAAPGTRAETPMSGCGPTPRTVARVVAADVRRRPPQGPAARSGGLRRRSLPVAQSRGRSTSWCTASWVGVWPRTSGWIPRPRVWPNCSGPAPVRVPAELVSVGKAGATVVSADPIPSALGSMPRRDIPTGE